MLNLHFGQGNAKLSSNIHTFSLPAGHSCPFANECLSKFVPERNRVQDGKNCKFRCYAASEEAVFTNVRAQRWENFNIIRRIRNTESVSRKLYQSLPSSAKYIRIHPSGDFFADYYFKAWLNIAYLMPDVTFYGYTKAIPYLLEHKLPPNFRFVASYGGKYDNLIDKYNLVSARVVFSTQEAERLNLPIDHDDLLAMSCSKSFALLLHGTQPKDTPAGEAWKSIKKTIGGYGTASKRHIVHKQPFKMII